jgi:hypothetical protein
MTASAPLDGETLISLSAVSATFPGSRGAVRVHPATVTRWILSGVRSPFGDRVRLEAVRVGHRWMTSREAVRRFVMETTAAAMPGDTPSANRSPSSERRAAYRAVRQLEKAGC